MLLFPHYPVPVIGSGYALLSRPNSQKPVTQILNSFEKPSQGPDINAFLAKFGYDKFLIVPCSYASEECQVSFASPRVPQLDQHPPDVLLFKEVPLGINQTEYGKMRIANYYPFPVKGNGTVRPALADFSCNRIR